MRQNATTPQFHKLLMRMMPECYSSMGEAKLIAAVISQAWADAADKQSARVFFTDPLSSLEFYCERVGLNAQQIREVFEKHNGAYKQHMQAEAA